jgi:hypothetical protein
MGLVFFLINENLSSFNKKNKTYQIFKNLIFYNKNNKNVLRLNILRLEEWIWDVLLINASEEFLDALNMFNIVFVNESIKGCVLPIKKKKDSTVILQESHRDNFFF